MVLFVCTYMVAGPLRYIVVKSASTSPTYKVSLLDPKTLCKVPPESFRETHELFSRPSTVPPLAWPVIKIESIFTSALELVITGVPLTWYAFTVSVPEVFIFPWFVLPG